MYGKAPTPVMYGPGGAMEKDVLLRICRAGSYRGFKAMLERLVCEVGEERAVYFSSLVEFVYASSKKAFLDMLKPALWCVGLALDAGLVAILNDTSSTQCGDTSLTENNTSDLRSRSEMLALYVNTVETMCNDEQPVHLSGSFDKSSVDSKELTSSVMCSPQGVAWWLVPHDKRKANH